jgi:hypothetical protein
MLWNWEEVKMNIYVGNLSYELTEEELQQAFEAFGQVESTKIIKDGYTGRSRDYQGRLYGQIKRIRIRGDAFQRGR